MGRGQALRLGTADCFDFSRLQLGAAGLGLLKPRSVAEAAMRKPRW